VSFRRLIAPLTVATVVATIGGEALAQGAFPAPPPGQAGQANDPASPPASGSSRAATVGTPPMSPFPSDGALPITGGPPIAGGGIAAAASDECTKEYLSLREEAEKRGQLIKAASQRHAPPDEACKLIANFSQAEMKMIKYVEQHAAKCEIPTRITDQLKSGHKTTEALQTKVCALAQQMQKRAPVGPTGDFWPTSTTPPI
jgi:hypothetical protein